MAKNPNKNSSILDCSDNIYVKNISSSGKELISKKELVDILEYEHGKHLAKCFQKEGALIELKDRLSKYEGEHSNSLALIIEIEAQKYELEELKKNLEALTQKLEILSVVDGLTNIANRRHFDDFLNKAWLGAMRDKQSISIVFVDVDFFKAYNDHYGHQKGDECLQKIATALSNFGMRSKDLAARYGGEEFAIILSGIDKENLLIMSEKIRKSVEDLSIPHTRSGVSNRVTVSLGIATCVPTRNSFSNDLLYTADKALYQAKDSGRNTLKFEEYNPRI